jgi:hypothetical protein
MAYDIDSLPGLIELGNLNELGVSLIEFDVTDWLTDYPLGVFNITYIRPGETDVYPVDVTGVSSAAPESGNLLLTVTEDEGELVSAVLTWTVSDAVTATAGSGSIVVELADGGTIKKRSDKVQSYTADGHAAAGDPPEPLQGWVDQYKAVDVVVNEVPTGETDGSVSKDSTGLHFILDIAKGNGIASIIRTAGTGAPGTVDTYTITFDDGTTQTYQVAHGVQGDAFVYEDFTPEQLAGLKGPTGNGIVSVTLTAGDHSPGTTDTYTITYTDATTATFTVYNGQDYQQDMPMTWAEFRNHVRQGTITNYFSVGDQFNVTKGATNLVFDIVDIGSSTRNVTANGNAPTDANFFVNFPNAKPVTLLMHDVIYSVAFDNVEANYKVIVAIGAGAANITLTHPAIAGGVATQYDFTVPAGGFALNSLLRIKDDGAKLLYYATPASAAVEVAIAAGAVNTPLVVSPAGGAVLSVQNDADRVRYGSNKYTESAIRQWLNASGAAGTFWTSKSDYDLAPSWHSTLVGFRNGMDADFLAVIGETTREVELNTITDGGGNATITDKIFLPSEKEIYGSAENVTHKGVEFQGYVPLADIDKIKYDAAEPSTVRHWWLRSPNAGTPGHARLVDSTTGALNYNRAYNGFGAAAACVIL